MHLEYIGTCLNRPLLADSSYLLKLHVGFLSATNSPPLNLVIYGSPACDNLPFTTTDADCPIFYPDWSIIGQKTVSSDGMSNVWLEFEIAVQPNIDINAIIIGADCSYGLFEDGVIYLLDNLILNDESNFDFERVDQKHFCDPQFTFAVAEKPGFSYQWYQAGIALVGETSAQLSQMYGEGAYQLRIIDEITQQCRLADEFDFMIPVIRHEVFETICEENSLSYEGDIIEEAGTYEYTLSSVDGCDAIVTLNVEMEIPQTSTFYIQKFSDKTYSIGDSHFTKEGEYQIDIITANGCDSTIVLYLENIKVFIPNAFSPNGDNINDYFEVFNSDDGFVTKELSIFDRWGNFLFRGDRWDGFYKKKYVNQGVYIYVVKLRNSNGEELILSNTVTVIR